MIREVRAWRVLDSRGNPTVRASVKTEKAEGSATAPSGASTGSHEVSPFGESAEASVELVNSEVASRLKGRDERDQKGADSVLHELDGTDDFSRLGGNAALAVSLAVLKAAAAGEGEPLALYINPSAKTFPYPLGNAVGGGVHGGGTDIQEFLLIPAGADNYPEAAFENAEMHRLLKQMLSEEDPHFLGGRNDEGAWTTSLSADSILELMASAIDEFDPEAKIGLDVAASEFFDGEEYVYEKQGMVLSQGEQIDYMADLAETFPIAYIEDPLDEDDFEGFSELNRRVECLVCGDDLTVTNPSRLLKAIEAKACNSLIVKPNQIGTVSEVFEVLDIAKKNSIAPVLSHRSGDTCDPAIAHLALARESLLLKTGIVGGERTAKHNELIGLWKEKSKMVKL